jgi:hypothetical protein
MFKIIKALFFILYPVFGKPVGIYKIVTLLNLTAYYYIAPVCKVEHISVYRNHEPFHEFRSPSISKLIEGYKAKE